MITSAKVQDLRHVLEFLAEKNEATKNSGEMVTDFLNSIIGATDL
jgi:hypothetical protein